MRDRIEALAGKFDINSSPLSGYQIALKSSGEILLPTGGLYVKYSFTTNIAMIRVLLVDEQSLIRKN